MELNEYQALAYETSCLTKIDEKFKIIYPSLGLCGEAGELLEKVKKAIRDEGANFSDAKKEEIAKELGDVIWYAAVTAIDLGYTLEDIATMNLNKIESRIERGVLNGEGDNR